MTRQRLQFWSIPSKMYRPKIKQKQLEKLYIIAENLEIPVTQVVEMAIAMFIRKKGKLLLEVEKSEG